MNRPLNLFISASALLVLSPVMAITALLIKLTMGGPVIFSQLRTGTHGRPFEIHKFRTMRDGTDASGTALPDDQRITRLGAFLRKSSLDELPGLWNVVNGEMNLVGPRPFMHEYHSLYNERQLRRFEVRGGITGWAQVNGRNAVSWEEKFDLDVWYVDNRSFMLDIRILLLTIKRVLTGSDVSADDQVTMQRFTGTPEPPVVGVTSNDEK